MKRVTLLTLIAWFCSCSPQSGEIAVSIDDPNNLIQNKEALLDSSFRINNYTMRIIEPDPRIDYKIVQIQPDSSVDYKILILDPHTKAPYKIPSPIQDALRNQILQAKPKEKGRQ